MANLNNVADGMPNARVNISSVHEEGFFVVDGAIVDDLDDFYDAVFTTEAGDNDITVGVVQGNQNYIALSRQMITVSGEQNRIGWNVTGSALDDEIFVNDDYSTIRAGAGDDRITLGNNGANVSIDGGAGSDQILVNGNNAYVFGGENADSITVGSGVSSITFADLDTAEDALAFDQSLELYSLMHSPSINRSNSTLSLLKKRTAISFSRPIGSLCISTTNRCLTCSIILSTTPALQPRSPSFSHRL